MDLPPLRYLSAADVRTAMPDVEARLELAATAMVALIDDAELPPKIGVHPAPSGSFAHAMPAWMRGPAADGSGDLLGIKWVAGFPANAALGMPAINGMAILNDAATGVPRAILDAGAITAHRTAAVSGVAISRWGPTGDAGAGPVVAIIGAGVQARSHLPVLGYLLPGAELRLCDRDASRVEALAAEVEAGVYGEFGSVQGMTDAIDAIKGATLVLTLASFGPERQTVPASAFGVDATIVAVDYDVCVPAEIAHDSALFLTDDRDQFLANRTGTQFVDYPEPMAMIGAAIRASTPRPDGRVLTTHLGVGLADVVFCDAILHKAEHLAIGTLLER